ncbi:MAG: hypothetical protein Q9228_003642, partial [Teloschistes exilis]
MKSVSETGEIALSDKCRLLYLFGADFKKHAPICPWPPFGSTPVEDPDLEVREHAECKEHCLLYQSWSWNTEGGPSCADGGFEGSATGDCWDGSAAWMDTNPDDSKCTDPIKYDETWKKASQIETGAVFRWLRSEGIPSHERAMFQHEWLRDNLSEDESLVDEDDSTYREHDKESRVEEWMSQVEAF